MALLREGKVEEAKELVNGSGEEEEEMTEAQVLTERTTGNFGKALKMREALHNKGSEKLERMHLDVKEQEEKVKELADKLRKATEEWDDVVETMGAKRTAQEAKEEGTEGDAVVREPSAPAEPAPAEPAGPAAADVGPLGVETFRTTLDSFEVVREPSAPAEPAPAEPAGPAAAGVGPLGVEMFRTPLASYEVVREPSAPAEPAPAEPAGPAAADVEPLGEEIFRTTLVNFEVVREPSAPAEPAPAEPAGPADAHLESFGKEMLRATLVNFEEGEREPPAPAEPAEPAAADEGPLREEILAAAPVDFDDLAVQASMMSQLIAGEEDSVSFNEIVPGPQGQIPLLHASRYRTAVMAAAGGTLLAKGGAVLCLVIASCWTGTLARQRPQVLNQGAVLDAAPGLKSGVVGFRPGSIDKAPAVAAGRWGARGARPGWSAPRPRLLAPQVPPPVPSLWEAAEHANTAAAYPWGAPTVAYAEKINQAILDSPPEPEPEEPEEPEAASAEIAGQVPDSSGADGASAQQATRPVDKVRQEFQWHEQPMEIGSVMKQHTNVALYQQEGCNLIARRIPFPNAREIPVVQQQIWKGAPGAQAAGATEDAAGSAFFGSDPLLQSSDGDAQPADDAAAEMSAKSFSESQAEVGQELVTAPGPSAIKVMQQAVMESELPELAIAAMNRFADHSGVQLACTKMLTSVAAWNKEAADQLGHDGAVKAVLDAVSSFKAIPEMRILIGSMSHLNDLSSANRETMFQQGAVDKLYEIKRAYPNDTVLELNMQRTFSTLCLHPNVMKDLMGHKYIKKSLEMMREFPDMQGHRGEVMESFRNCFAFSNGARQEMIKEGIASELMAGLRPADSIKQSDMISPARLQYNSLKLVSALSDSHPKFAKGLVDQGAFNSIASVVEGGVDEANFFAYDVAEAVCQAATSLFGLKVSAGVPRHRLTAEQRNILLDSNLPHELHKKFPGGSRDMEFRPNCHALLVASQ